MLARGRAPLLDFCRECPCLVNVQARVVLLLGNHPLDAWMRSQATGLLRLRRIGVSGIDVPLLVYAGMVCATLVDADAMATLVPLPAVDPDGLPHADQVSFGLRHLDNLPVTAHMFAVLSAVVDAVRVGLLPLPTPSHLADYVPNAEDSRFTTLADIGSRVCSSRAWPAAYSVDTSARRSPRQWLEVIESFLSSGTPSLSWGTAVILLLQGRVVGFVLPKQRQAPALLICPYIPGLFDGEKGLSVALLASATDLHLYMQKLLHGSRTDPVESWILQCDVPQGAFAADGGFARTAPTSGAPAHTGTAPTAPADAARIAASAGGASASTGEGPFPIAGADSSVASRTRLRSRECARSRLYGLYPDPASLTHAGP